MNKSQQDETMDQFTQDLMGPGYSRSPMRGQGSMGQRLLGTANQGQGQGQGQDSVNNGPSVQPTSMGTPAPAPAVRFNQAQAGPMYGDNDMSALDIYKPNPKSQYRPSMLDVQDRGNQFGIPADMSQKWYNTNYPAPVQAPAPAQDQGYDEMAARQRMGNSGIMVGN